MPLCTDLSVVNGNSFEGQISMLRCKRWSCEVCNPVNRSRVIALAGKGQATAMLTLTCDPKHHATPDDAARAMKKALVLLRRMIERQWGIEKLPFFAVFEKHKSGWPHLHLLIRAKYMHWQVIRGMWWKLMRAYITDIRSIHSRKGMYRYVTKYIGKDLSAFEGCKRWWRSHNFHVDKDELDENPFAHFGYRRIHLNFEKVRTFLAVMRYDFEQTRAYTYQYRARPPDHERCTKPLNWSDFQR